MVWGQVLASGYSVYSLYKISIVYIVRGIREGKYGSTEPYVVYKTLLFEM